MNRRLFPRAGFTLIELLAVVIIIATLVGLVFGLFHYVDTGVKVSRTKAELAAMEMAIDSFKLDQGYYPTSSIVRVSCSSQAEAMNSAMLYQALVNGPRRYIQFTPRQIQNPYTIQWAANPNSLGTIATNVIVDPWGRPYNYYCTAPPLVAMLNVNLYASTGQAWQGSLIGGQVNRVTYDLWSYGPNMITYAGPNPGFMDWLRNGMWTASNGGGDDIGNFK